MKHLRIAAFIIIILMISSLTGCSVETAETHDKRVNTSETTQTEKTVPETAASETSSVTSTAKVTSESAQTEQTQGQTAAQTNEKNENAVSADSAVNDADDENQNIPSDNSFAENTDAPEICDENNISVSVSIRCDSAVDNWDNLENGVQNNNVIPQDGVILNTIQLSVKQGSTVFSVLKEACENNGIKLDYSGNEKRKTVYVTGINGLYEKECGSMSGWIYTVNSEKCMTGASGYVLSDGDTVEFSYTV